MTKNSSINEFDDTKLKYQFKLVLLGDGGVGKTCLVNRFCFNEFFLDTKITIGLSFNSFSINAIQDENEIKIGLSLWDFGGQERFRPLLPQFISGANAALFVFDLFSFRSLENLLKEWKPLLDQNGGNIPTALVGTKYDLFSHNQDFPVSREEITEYYQKELRASHFYETSSKTGYNTIDIFKKLVQEILDGPSLKDKKIKVI